MTYITHYRSDYSELTKTLPASSPASAETSFRCLMYKFEDYGVAKPAPPPNFKHLSKVLADSEARPERKAALAEARKWLAEEFHSDSSDTVRSLRLQNGWSQVMLAEMLGTSQPHIARIEKGTENLSIETCRKLCAVFKIDMNTLNQLLRNQEALGQTQK